MKPALLLLNGEAPSKELILDWLPQVDFFLAADGAANILADYDLAPQAILGDMDSISEKTKAKFAHIEKIDRPDQDLTDGQKGLYYLKSEGFKSVVILGGFGKRPDHLLHHFSLLAAQDFADLGIRMISETEEVLLGRNEITLSGWPGRRISIMPIYGAIPSFSAKA